MKYPYYILNTEVKLFCADGTALCGRVGAARLAKQIKYFVVSLYVVTGIFGSNIQGCQNS